MTLGEHISDAFYRAVALLERKYGRSLRSKLPQRLALSVGSVISLGVFIMIHDAKPLKEFDASDWADVAKGTLPFIGAVLFVWLSKTILRSPLYLYARDINDELSATNKDIPERFQPTPRTHKGHFRLWIRESHPHGVRTFDVIHHRSLPIADLGKISGEINTRAYRRSTWADEERKKIQRNTAHLYKNKHTIMLIQAKDRNQENKGYFGFTHVLPLTEIGHMEYRLGQHADNDFPERLICENGERFSALLLFSFALDNPLPSKAPQEPLVCLMKGLHDHVLELMDSTEQTETTLLIQHDPVFKLRWAERMFGFKPTGTNTKDGGPLYEAKAMVRKFDWME